MKRSIVTALVAAIILGGHFLVFFFGLLLGVFGSLRGVELVQTVLMASPVLGVTAASALSFALRNDTGASHDELVTPLFAGVCLIAPMALLLCIFLVFLAFYRQMQDFGPAQMKVALGGIETFFGVYLGSISDTLFGRRLPKPQ